ncbi:MAG: dihydropyrimidinase [Niameybacter sp.]|uniref:dihydropyrimidinase n=2 Tax=Niameybacter sp. TaxID=2033640 RepID=UPI002FCB72C6
MRILIKGGRLATELEKGPIDILIEDGVIVGIGQISTGDQVIEAYGNILFPGFIDAHTHLDMDTGTAHTSDDFASGTRAALVGGTTTILDFATQDKGDTLMNALKMWQQKACGKSYTDYGFHIAITDWNEHISKELLFMKDAGITSFKVYMAYDALKVTDDALYEILQSVDRLGGIVGCHCENGDLVKVLSKEQKGLGHLGPSAHPDSRPDTVESEAIGRFLDIAYLAGATVHVVHLSTEKGLEVVKRTKARGQKVYVETCPQYLTLDESAYTLKNFEGAKYVLSPPLRTKQDQQALWQGLQKEWIHTISTDHCAFNFETGKKQGLADFTAIPNGVPGIEHRAQLIYTFGVDKERLSLKQMVNLLSTHAAKLFGLYPTKGTLQIGSDADLVIWNPHYVGTLSKATQLQQVDYTPYEGLLVKGRAEHVLLRGVHVVKEGKVIEQCQGQYLFRGPTGNLG